MGLFSSDASWTSQANQRDKDRKAAAKFKKLRAAKRRRDNRKHMIEHPIRHARLSIFR